jgi:hypothetical protein
MAANKIAPGTRVGEGIAVSVNVGKGVYVSVGVAVDVSVGVSVGVSVEVGVNVSVGVGVEVAVNVGDGVYVAVEVGDGVSVSVDDAVLVGVTDSLTGPYVGKLIGWFGKWQLVVRSKKGANNVNNLQYLFHGLIAFSTCILLLNPSL